MYRNEYEDFDRIFRGEEFIIATDFDDTLVEAGRFPEFGEDTKWFDTLQKIKAAYPNVKIILWTCREGKALAEAVTFCRENGLTFDAVNEDIPSSLEWKGKTRKPFAHIYVDDRNRCVSDFDDFFFERDALLAENAHQG